ncbi:hypothetical protein PsYK624_163870 [Phanerochaete sordida]|uniref:Uncharacterized protein n=1 Tax=Phanerochaete sordida TaxID=48140 RepID=A0A9P3LNE9_9APHY|nr:hypothetical protein PsYK624_163870 [Phanerochaete sordida]
MASHGTTTADAGPLPCLYKDLSWLEYHLRQLYELANRSTQGRRTQKHERRAALTDLRTNMPVQARYTCDWLGRMADTECSGQAAMRALDEEWGTALRAVEDTVDLLARDLDVLQRCLARDAEERAAAQQQIKRLESDLKSAQAKLQAKTSDARRYREKLADEERRRVIEEHAHDQTRRRTKDLEATCLLLCTELDWARRSGYKVGVELCPTQTIDIQIVEQLADWAAEKNTSDWERHERRSRESSQRQTTSTRTQHQGGTAATQGNGRTEDIRETLRFQVEMNAAARDRITALTMELNDMRERAAWLEVQWGSGRARIAELVKEARETRRKHAQELEEARRCAREDTARLSRALEETEANNAREIAKLKTENALRVYNSAWDILSARALSFGCIPWPVFDAPNNAQEITLAAVRRFLFTDSTTTGGAKRSILKKALLRWHPDKFASVLVRVQESERANVKCAVDLVAGFLNDLNQEA